MSKPNGKAVVSLDFLKSMNDRQPVEVYVPQWDAVAFLVPLSSQQAIDHQMLLAESWKKYDAGKLRRMPDFKAQAVGECLTDEQGKRVCETATDIEGLKNANGAAISFLYDRLQEISGLDKNATSDAGKNLPQTTDSDSFSGLRSLSDEQ